MIGRPRQYHAATRTSSARQHHPDLQRAVAQAVSALRELVEDACRSAWTTMLRILYVVPTPEAFRLSEGDRRHVLLDERLPGAWDAVIADA